MKVIVGLGNPGVQYYATRHNAGFRVLEGLGTKTGAHFSKKRSLFCDLVKVGVNGAELLLVKPDTYMNASGQAIAAVLNWYKIAASHMLVVHDDVSLPLGKLRFQRGGGAGGQHGVESIIECLGGLKDFDRLKIGVGPDPGGERRAEYVLKPVSESELQLFLRSISTAEEAAIIWLTHGIREAMNQYNGLDLNPTTVVDEPPDVDSSSPAVSPKTNST